MREYQCKKNNPYLLPKNLYYQVKYMIKDYQRLKEEYEKLSNTCEEERNWVKVCTTATKISAIKTALLKIPVEFREGLLNNIDNERNIKGYYPLNADQRTYQKYKQKLIYYVAENMNYV